MVMWNRRRFGIENENFISGEINIFLRCIEVKLHNPLFMTIYGTKEYVAMCLLMSFAFSFDNAKY